MKRSIQALFVFPVGILLLGVLLIARPVVAQGTRGESGIELYRALKQFQLSGGATAAENLTLNRMLKNG